MTYPVPIKECTARRIHPALAIAGISEDPSWVVPKPERTTQAMSDYECCASGSCEVCRRPRGYSREQRERIERDQRDYEPPWVREHRRDGWAVSR